MIKVKNEVTIYEVDGKEPTSLIDGPKVIIESHWNYNDRVVLRVNGGGPITVLSKDLIAAVANATNTGKW